MLIDKDTSPKDTILYLSAILLEKFKEQKRIEVNSLDDVFFEMAPTQPSFKLHLSLNFLFLLDKIKLDGGDLVYVP